MLAKRLADYSYGYWRDHHMTKWPTIREAAKALRARQIDIAEAIEDDARLQRTYFLVYGETPLGDYFVEAYNDARVDADLDEYWRNFDRPVLRVITGGLT